MNNEIRCLRCGRLLGKLLDGHGEGSAQVSVQIKCKCGYMNAKLIKINKDVVQTAGNAV